MNATGTAPRRRRWWSRRRQVDGDERPQPRKRIWVQHVDAELEGLRIRVAVERAKGLTPAQEVAADGVELLITRAQRAADRIDPIPGRIMNWWRGTLVETAYRNLHSARAQMVDLYDEAELNAEIPAVVSRVHATLSLSDPRRVSSEDLRHLPLPDRRAWLRRLIEDSYDALDMKYSRLHNFRNIVLSAALVISGLLLVAMSIMWAHPGFIPLCFPASDVPVGAPTRVLNCPTRTLAPGPQQWDVVVVALLGLLGGALATSVAIRKIQGAGVPYDVPVALAWLKVPLGAFVAVLGIVAIQGGFIPGLSRLDTQEQILAYALLLGFAQQLFTGVLDSKAQSLVADLPTKESGGETRVVSEPMVAEAEPASPGDTAVAAPRVPQQRAAPESERVTDPAPTGDRPDSGA